MLVRPGSFGNREEREVYCRETAGRTDSMAALQRLESFESFVASYFTPAFTNAFVLAGRSPEPGVPPTLLPIRKVNGDWQMFPRDNTVIPLITDGRWSLQPHPVTWSIGSPLWFPLSCRRDPVTGLTAILLSPPSDCFAIATPHETEGHYSTYLSLFGRDLSSGETARGRVRLMIATVESVEPLATVPEDFDQ